MTGEQVSARPSPGDYRRVQGGSGTPQQPSMMMSGQRPMGGSSSAESVRFGASSGAQLPAGASLEQRLLALEAADLRQTKDMKRVEEFLKSQLNSLERMDSRRFDSLEARHKSLEQRIERMTGAVLDEAKSSVREVLVGQGEKIQELLHEQKQHQRERQHHEPPQPDVQTLQHHQLLMNRQDRLDKELERLQDRLDKEVQRLQERALHSDDRMHSHMKDTLDDMIKGQIADLSEKIRAAQFSAPAPFVVGQKAGDVMPFYQPPQTQGFPSNNSMQLQRHQEKLREPALQLPELRDFAPAPNPHLSPHPRFLSLSLGSPPAFDPLPLESAPPTVDDSKPPGWGVPSAGATLMPTHVLANQSAALEQVQHLSEALSLWAARQRGCERRITNLESKLGITPLLPEHDNEIQQGSRNKQLCC